ncbi:MAG: hypothetical protein MMC33_005854 [Icmadophila ericetorum]|nr:hypothetical protein [Icmadophila ericetorum]
MWRAFLWHRLRLRMQNMQTYALGQTPQGCNTAAPIFPSPPPSTTSAESDDCRITIKQISPTNRTSLQKATPSDIRARVNRAIKDSRCEEIAHLSVLGAKSLPSGDVAIFTANAENVQTLRDHNKHWVTCLSPEARCTSQRLG